jgi:hypothetical protein
MSQYLPLWAAMPAVALGLWLLRVAEAPRSVQATQVAVVVVAVAVSATTVRLRRHWPVSAPPWLAPALALSLCIPVVAGAPGEPARWLVVGGARLYLAPLVVPPLLLLLAASAGASAVFVVSVAAAVVAFVLQSDAAQMTAWALALLVVLAADEVSRQVWLVLVVVLLGGAIAGWRTPDPLVPVRYVEGVFAVAADASAGALVAAIAAAALPVAALMWVASRMRSRGTLAVAVYFGALFALAPWQVTPVPLLGFGSGPILGYFLAAGLVSRGRDDPAGLPAAQRSGSSSSQRA